MVKWGDIRLIHREIVFQKLFAGRFVEPKYAVVWEDPTQPDEPVRVLIAAPVWLSMALHGYILPPVEVYWALNADEAQPGFKRHHRKHLLDEVKPLPPMTEEQAMEYLIMKDVPAHVWHGYSGNREILKIVPRDVIPSDRRLRGAWRILQGAENVG